MTRIHRTFSTTALMTVAACLLWVSPAAADQVILDDLIVDGSACIGFDCVNGESFGFDTIRIKENNLRIKADDTSTAASFPRVDWQITFNDSANGGQAKFAIDDISGGRTPFTIEANAPSHSLYVDDGGRLGLGTSVPVADLHVKSGNTPTLRLEQDGSSGFTPQTWDVAGNEANFFVRDATGGSTLPFKIKPGGAPSNSLVIAADGNVGLGTASPDTDEKFIVSRPGTVLSVIKSSDNGAVQHRLISSSSNRRFLGMSDSSSPQSQIILGDNEVKIAGIDGSTNLFATFNSSGLTLQALCEDSVPGGGCDSVFEPTYELPSIEEHAAFMWENKHLPAIGPTPEGKKIPISIGQRHFGMLNELEKAHIYIDQLNSRLEESEDRNKDLLSRLEAIEQILAEESSGAK